MHAQAMLLSNAKFIVDREAVSVMEKLMQVLLDKISQKPWFPK
jgi:hypothetical protein